MFRPSNPKPDPTSANLLTTLRAAGRRAIDPATSPYMLPNTLEEAKRLDLQHFILQQALRGNVIAPIGAPQQIGDEQPPGQWTNYLLSQIMQTHREIAPHQPHHILDIGCGTGRWAIELARQFDQATVVGIDIVPPERPFTDELPLPTNYHFQLGNILQGLPFPAGSFDYVHMRIMGLGIPADQWLTVINELARLTAPGGWIESVECGLPTDGGPALQRCIGAFTQILTARGIDLARTRTLDDCFRRAQPPLAAVQSRVVDIPLGAHGGGIGVRMAWNCRNAIQNMGQFFQQAHLFTAEEWEDLLLEIDAELHDPQYHTMLACHLAIARRTA